MGYKKGAGQLFDEIFRILVEQAFQVLVAYLI